MTPVTNAADVSPDTLEWIFRNVDALIDSNINLITPSEHVSYRDLIYAAYVGFPCSQGLFAIGDSPAELIYNEMHVTFRRNRQGETGSVFVIRQGLDFRVNPPAKFTITDIERINLKTFISMFWLDAGFNTLDDACRYYAATYADELGETSAPNFEKINGWIYKFRRLEDE